MSLLPPRGFPSRSPWRPYARGASRIPDEAIVSFSPVFALAVTATVTVEPLTIQAVASLEVGPALQILAVSVRGCRLTKRGSGGLWAGPSPFAHTGHGGRRTRDWQ